VGGTSESVAVAETVELRVSEGSFKLSEVAVVVEPPSAKRLERRLDACSGVSVCVTDGSVVVPDGKT